MVDIAHLLRPTHLQQLRNILDDAEASGNDKFVALELLKNANVAAGVRGGKNVGAVVDSAMSPETGPPAAHPHGLLGANGDRAGCEPLGCSFCLLNILPSVFLTDFRSPLPVGMILPGCQDTGTATVMGKKGQYVWTNERDEEALSKGVFKAYTETNLR
jgi:hypothetical protein